VGIEKGGGAFRESPGARRCCSPIREWMEYCSDILAEFLSEVFTASKF
jgi:hypothetical protein